ncbi:MAG: M14 family zinc carboxypeptidase [Candidatus Zixiibacteriota bacterium]
MNAIRRMIPMLFLTFLLAAAVWGTDDVYLEVRVDLDTPDELRQLYRLNPDIVQVGYKSVTLITDKKGVEELTASGFKFEITNEDLEAFYQSRFPDKDYTGYMTLSQIMTELFFLHYLYPDITTDTISIGQTIEGRSIIAFKISDNPEVDEDEPEVFFNAAIHAREVITPLIILDFISYLLENYGTDSVATHLVNDRELWFVPVVNPDGYQYNVTYNWPGGMWRKNRRNNGDGSFGVDLNRNFGYMWGYDNAGSSPDGIDETFRGIAPFSEPASQAFRDFVLAHNFSLTLNYHSCSNLYLWAYAYNNVFTPDEDIFRALGDSMNTFNGYEAGLNAIGYPVNGGVDDWMYGEQTLKDKVISMTCEAGNYYADGFWPETYRIPELLAENMQSNLFFAEIAGHVETVLKPIPPTLTVPDSIDNGSPLEITWVHDDTRNPAVQYELIEMSDYQVVVDDASNFNNWYSRYFNLEGGVFHSGTSNSAPRYMTALLPYTVQPNDTLRFMTYFEIAAAEDGGWDFAYAEVSTDGINFTTLPGNITSNANPFGHNRGNGITGWSGAEWIEAKFDLSDYVGQPVYFRISYDVYEKAFAGGGIWLDDIRPVASFGNYGIIASDLTETAYTFSSKPEGIYYYKARALDGDGQWGEYSEVKSVVVGNPVICMDPDGDGLGTPGWPGSNCPEDNCPAVYNPDQTDSDLDGIGDVCDACTDLDGDGYGEPGFPANACIPDNCPNLYNPDQDDFDSDGIGDMCELCGDADNSNAVNLLDATYLIKYLYKGGPPPVQTWMADNDGNGSLNLLDVTYLINYLYKAGPSPVCS